jgi:hypothetical protein
MRSGRACLGFATALVGCGTEPTSEVVGPYTGETRRFVVSRFELPISRDDAEVIGDDLDGDSLVDNRLGRLIGSLALQGKAPMHVDQMLAAGTIASFVEIKADHFTEDDTVSVRYLGTEASAAIVAGGEFDVGVYRSNRTRSTRVPGQSELVLPVFGGADPSVFRLDAMQIDLEPDGDGYLATICGGVEQGLARQVTAKGLVEMIRSNPAAHADTIGLLDANTDGTVTLDEVNAAPMITLFVSEDVDVWVDGAFSPRISLGFRVRLSPCTKGNCVLATPELPCFDRIVDGDETDVDLRRQLCARLRRRSNVSGRRRLPVTRVRRRRLRGAVT